LQTDTASVLLEAIGYIRFLQNQIEVVAFSLADIPYPFGFVQKEKKKKHGLAMMSLSIVTGSTKCSSCLIFFAGAQFTLHWQCFRKNEAPSICKKSLLFLL